MWVISKARNAYFPMVPALAHHRLKVRGNLIRKQLMKHGLSRTAFSQLMRRAPPEVARLASLLLLATGVVVVLKGLLFCSCRIRRSRHPNIESRTLALDPRGLDRMSIFLIVGKISCFSCNRIAREGCRMRVPCGRLLARWYNDAAAVILGRTGVGECGTMLTIPESKVHTSQGAISLSRKTA